MSDTPLAESDSPVITASCGAAVQPGQDQISNLAHYAPCAEPHSRLAARTGKWCGEKSTPTKCRLANSRQDRSDPCSTTCQQSTCRACLSFRAQTSSPHRSATSQASLRCDGGHGTLQRSSSCEHDSELCRRCQDCYGFFCERISLHTRQVIVTQPP